MKFEEIGLNDEIVKSLTMMNIFEPTDVQLESIPKIFAGKDAIIRAKTGTGKTLAILLPLIQKLKENRGRGEPRLLILAPTRELALQISGVAMKLINRNRVITVYGGSSINIQIGALRSGVDIVIGTPGRTIDLIERKALVLNSIEYFIIDEADMMWDMGFIEDVEYILDATPTNKQIIILSATIPKEIIDLSKKRMINPEIISVGKNEEITVESIKHVYSIAAGVQKFHMLLAYIEKYNPDKAIIFMQTKRESDILHNFLVKQGLDAILMHGGLTQAKRIKALGKFRHSSRFLIATNVASRGLDIADISDIINFDIPDTSNIYVHRVGRTARMGKDGRAFSVITRSQIGIIRDIEYEANIRMERISLDIRAYEHIPVNFRLDRHRNIDSQHGTERNHGTNNRRFGAKPNRKFNDKSSSDRRFTKKRYEYRK